MGDGFQLVVLDLARKLCRSHPHEKSRYIRCIITLMETASDAVLFECANTLVAVSNAPTAVKSAAGCYTQVYDEGFFFVGGVVFF
jgi:coatomer subunit beta